MKALLLTLVVSACVETATVPCGADLVCPQNTTCSHITAPEDDICATAEQLGACADKAEGDACMYTDAPPDSWCHDGVCIARACGNIRLDPGEVCDDGNTSSGDGSCSGDCGSTEVCGNGIVDPLARDGDGNPIANEACDDGNRISADGCSSTCKAEQWRWSSIGDKPFALSESSIAYDPVRGRVVLFGGERLIGGNHVQTPELYEWNGSDWARIPTTGGPAGRRYAGMAYDAARRVMVVFAGQVDDDDDVTPLGDQWEWDGAHWSLRTVTSGPSPRTKFGMVYDGARKKIVVFGGLGRNATGVVSLDDTWEWDGTSWTQVTAAIHPSARFGHVMAYDPVRGVTVVAGGSSAVLTTAHPRDTWEYDGTWRQVNSNAPSDLDLGSAMAFDPTSNSMLAYGGLADPYSMTSATWSNRTLSYNGLSWTPSTPTGPGRRYLAAMATDVRAGNVVFFGGMDDGLARFNDTWVWNGAWSMPTPLVTPGLMNSTSAHDPLRGVTWLFGGMDATRAATDALWSFDGTTWTDRTTAGPSPRMMAAVAVDPVLNKLVVFGGAVLSGSNYVPVTGETWMFDGTSWSSSTPAMTPTPRFGATAYFDRNRGRVVLFGGATAGLVPLQDMWEWTGTTWQPISTSTTPMPRGFATATFDAVRSEAVMWGGFELGAAGPIALTETWLYDGANWALAASTNPMSRRVWSELAYDEASRQVLMFGGLGLGAGGFADSWRWSGTAWEQLLTTETPPSRGAHVTFPANDGRGIVIHGGGTETDAGGTRRGDTWRLRYENDESFEQCLLTVDDDGDGLMGCGDPDCWATCTPLCPPGATCDASAPRCGDGTCNASLESCRNCPQDCATCTAACGDGYCDAPETLATCRGDCTP